MSNNSIDGFILTNNGEVDLVGLGIVNGVTLGVASAIYEQLNDEVVDHLEGVNIDGDRVLDFTLSNISFMDGQMSFPETGQWDFPPYFEFDLTVTKNEIIEESQC